MEKSLDFKVVFYMLRTKFIWVVLAGIVGALVAFAVSSFLLTEQFTSSTRVYISNTQEVEESTISNGDLSASKSMAKTYRIILESRRATELLKEKLKQDTRYTGSKIRSYKTSFSVVDNTEILNIIVESPDPEIAALVCNTMVQVAIELVSDIFDGGKCNSLGEAVPNYSPSSPNTRMNMVVGMLIGFAISGALVVFWFLLDNRVKDESDFVQKVGIPVLGEVPSMHEDAPRVKRSKKNKKGKGYYYAYANKSNK